MLFKRYVLFFLILLQSIAPLVHAHVQVECTNNNGEIHIHKQAHVLREQVGHYQAPHQHDVIVELESAIKKDKKSKLDNVVQVFYLPSSAVNHVAIIKHVATFSPPSLIRLFSSLSYRFSPRAPPYLKTV